eukprot:GHVO01066020.1.p1 GENE.GHVO01066020.1~~GHVO01066020.1.p1  ORF type:complete len:244 (+),score=37.43 GHVO01066020.1:640-1371(+)
MHANSEGNASAAQDVDACVTDIFLHLERQNEAINQFHFEVTKIPQIVNDIKKVMDKIGEMEVLFSEVNEGLADLQDIEEEHRLLRDMHQHHSQLKLYAQKQKSETDKLRKKMSSEHAYKVQIHEAKLQETLREKQEAIQEAYSEEMQNYKIFGQTQFKPSENKTESSLADISIEEDDQSELDDFLKSQELQSDSQFFIFIFQVPEINFVSDAVASTTSEKSEEENENQVEVKTDQDFNATNQT